MAKVVAQVVATPTNQTEADQAKALMIIKDGEIPTW
jgi:hypothetical protein